MTAHPPRSLPDDAFLDRDGRPDSCAPRVESNGALRPGHGASSPANRDDDIVMSPSPARGQVHLDAHTASSPLPVSVNTLGDTSKLPNEHSPSPPGHNHAPLFISTETSSASPQRSDSLKDRGDRLSTSQQNAALQRKTSNSNLQPVSRTPSWKQHLTKSISSATSSAYPSPVISAMGDVTPLPSPLLSSDSPGPWKRLITPTPSRELTVPTIMPDSVFVTKSGESVATAIENQSKRKVYAGLQVGHAIEHSSGKNEHTRNRSISEYIPDPKGIPKRQNTVASGKVDERNREDAAGLRREPRLSEARGLALPASPPTPPPSESSLSNDNSGSKRTSYEYFEARGRKDQKLRRWRGIKDLGEGTFSRVVLATSRLDIDAPTDSRIQTGSEARTAPVTVPQLDPKTLVAIKICEHGPKGGASEDRIEMSLKRELDIMRSIDHPSLVHLKAWSIEPTRALLVLNYSPGGDLFDVASNYRDSLKAPILRRIFSEVVGAVGYLHERRIVHRDIKLENVLVNVSPTELISPTQDWTTYPYPVITLTDLGLSRRVADDEKLETRCGSDDYAAPEVILGQSYDGRATDAWSLGVLLYALIESRLPFDPPPGASDYQRMRSRTSHRIARVEWSWVKYAGEDGDHDANIALFEKDQLKGAMEITEGLLRRARSRWSMRQVIDHEWVRGAIQVEGGLKFPEEEDGQEVL
ncbi:kinase-like domain-containing protein [Xylaria sp. FL0064]|nr:kinase-like domain-containing protein [Xylaria sp. FL0064]